jgi:hypothetical protein
LVTLTGEAVAVPDRPAPPFFEVPVAVYPVIAESPVEVGTPKLTTTLTPDTAASGACGALGAPGTALAVGVAVAVPVVVVVVVVVVVALIVVVLGSTVTGAGGAVELEIGSSAQPTPSWGRNPVGDTPTPAMLSHASVTAAAGAQSRCSSSLSAASDRPGSIGVPSGRRISK